MQGFVHVFIIDLHYFRVATEIDLHSYFVKFGKLT